MLNHRLDRSESGATGKKDNGPAAVFAKKECALRSFKAKDVLFLHRIDRGGAGAKEGIGEGAARGVSNVEFDLLVLMWRIGHGIASAFAILQKNVNVLTGQKLEILGGRKL